MVSKKEINQILKERIANSAACFNKLMNLFNKTSKTSSVDNTFKKRIGSIKPPHVFNQILKEYAGFTGMKLEYLCSRIDKVLNIRPDINYKIIQVYSLINGFGYAKDKNQELTFTSFNDSCHLTYALQCSCFLTFDKRFYKKMVAALEFIYSLMQVKPNYKLMEMKNCKSINISHNTMYALKRNRGI